MAFLPRPVLGAALACAVFLTFPASPAYAHDTLKRSSPAKDAQVSSLEEIELEYTASVKFPFVVLHDAAGNEVGLSRPRLSGPTVTAEVTGPIAPGAYTIAWRVVSSDGHPIEGEIPFRVKGSRSPAASASSVPSTEPSAVEFTATAVPPAAPAGVPVWIWGGLAGLVVVGAVVAIRTSRRAPDREDADAD
ncbi:hypothetical protein SAMN05444920_110256 [Nonomuraea solani]|uniref:CopC domain-containing protein n=1 Tax=Nonomuraea solani TaxID=1144553 RepID=A0A1H6EH58_9ACTN|nr:copper resistance protein CopC [Nonomuraea solani]SEG97177.1 hypothetical protein SAMN05444920_110256 [Nonomuraea solani]